MSEITPDQAKAILDADARNVISMVQAGTPLPEGIRKRYEALMGEKKAEWVAHSHEEIAEIIGVSQKTVTDWMRKNGWKKQKDYDFRAFILAYCKGQRAAAAGRGVSVEVGGEELNATAEKALLSREQRKKLELENAKTEETLITVAEVQEHNQRAILAARSRLLAIGPKLAPRLGSAKTPGERRKMIDAEVYDALRELASGKWRE